jgi:hypothetical protein
MFLDNIETRTKATCCCPEGSIEGVITNYKPKGTFT